MEYLEVIKLLRKPLFVQNEPGIKHCLYFDCTFNKLDFDNCRVSIKSKIKLDSLNNTTFEVEL